MKNGFTLMELLAVIVVMALIGTASVIFFSASNDSQDQEDLRNKYIQIQDAAKVYVDLNESWLSSFSTGNEIYVRLGELQSTNYFSNAIKNPIDGKDFPSSYLIKIYKTSLDGTENTSYVDSCIIQRIGSNTKCIANSEGNPCGCCDLPSQGDLNPSC